MLFIPLSNKKLLTLMFYPKLLLITINPNYLYYINKFSAYFYISYPVHVRPRNFDYWGVLSMLFIPLSNKKLLTLMFYPKLLLITINPTYLYYINKFSAYFYISYPVRVHPLKNQCIILILLLFVIIYS
jgi:hypothetical protein